MQKLPAGISTNSKRAPFGKVVVYTRPVALVGDCAIHLWRIGRLFVLVGVGLLILGLGAGVGFGLSPGPVCALIAVTNTKQTTHIKSIVFVAFILFFLGFEFG
jgi:hypothetical protein